MFRMAFASTFGGTAGRIISRMFNGTVIKFETEIEALRSFETLRDEMEFVARGSTEIFGVLSLYSIEKGMMKSCVICADERITTQRHL